MGAPVTAQPARRHRIWIGILVIIGVFLALRGLTALNDHRDGAQTTASATSTLPTRTVTAGAVTVQLRPTRLNDGGAVIDVAFDTHSVDLGLNLTDNAHLVVDGTAWPVSGWSGDGPGGHHRAGVLTFTPGGPATGTARLSIDGLPEPVTASWSTGR